MASGWALSSQSHIASSREQAIREAVPHFRMENENVGRTAPRTGTDRRTGPACGINTRDCHIPSVISRTLALASGCMLQFKELLSPDLDLIKQEEQAARPAGGGPSSR
jgi:hypothetical protein